DVIMVSAHRRGADNRDVEPFDLAWFRLHPRDLHVPIVLSEAVRDRAAFACLADALHRPTIRLHGLRDGGNRLSRCTLPLHKADVGPSLPPGGIARTFLGGDTVLRRLPPRLQLSIERRLQVNGDELDDTHRERLTLRLVLVESTLRCR